MYVACMYLTISVQYVLILSIKAVDLSTTWAMQE